MLTCGSSFFVILSTCHGPRWFPSTLKANMWQQESSRKNVLIMRYTDIPYFYVITALEYCLILFSCSWSLLHTITIIIIAIIVTFILNSFSSMGATQCRKCIQFNDFSLLYLQSSCLLSSRISRHALAEGKHRIKLVVSDFHAKVPVLGWNSSAMKLLNLHALNRSWTLVKHDTALMSVEIELHVR